MKFDHIRHYANLGCPIFASFNYLLSNELTQIKVSFAKYSLQFANL
jgi:hypothetical protein